MVQPTAGGKVNAANLNFNGLNALAAVLGTDNVIISPTAGGPNRRATVAQIIAGAMVPDPLLLGDGDEADPTYSYLSDSETGVFLSSLGVLGFGAAGSEAFNMSATQFRAAIALGPAIMNEAPAAQNPVFVISKGFTGTGIGGVGDEMMLISDGQRVAEIQSAPGFRLDVPLRFFVLNGPQINNVAAGVATANLNPRQGDNTGVGWRTMGVGVLVGGGENAMEFGGVGAVPQVGFYGTAAINQQTGVAVTDVAIHAALVNLGLITA